MINTAEHRRTRPTGQGEHRRQLSRAVIVLLLMVVPTVAGIAPNASAWNVEQSSGRAGNLQFFPTQVYAGAQFQSGQVIVSRNGAVPLGQPQQVDVAVSLEYRVVSGSQGRWVAADATYWNGTVVIGPVSQNTVSEAAVLVPRYNGLSPRAGYYRVVYRITWRQAWVANGGLSAVTGSQFVVSSVAADHRCMVAACKALPGSVQVW